MPYTEDDYRVLGLHGQSRDREDMVGADHTEILGAEEILGALSKNPALQAAIARRIGQRVPVVKTVAPTKKRRYTVGFGPTLLHFGTGGLGQQVAMISRPQELFRGEKLLMRCTGLPSSSISAADALDNVFITGMFVGAKSQLPTLENPISCGSFDKGVLDNEQMFDTADPAINIQINVANGNSFDVTISATLIGHTVL